MSNLENLLSKIAKDSEAKAKEIIADAEQKAESIKAEKAAEAQRETAPILAAGELEAERAAQRVISTNKRKIRDDLLKAKKDILDNVFDQALAKLNQLDIASFLEFVKRSLLETDTDGVEILLPSHYGSIDVSQLNDYLVSQGKKGNLVQYQGARQINGGFILMKAGIEYNYTFEAILSSKRDALEKEILESLY